VTFGPWWKTEFFANYGEGYHSNDARSLFVDNTKAGAPVTPLPKSMGTEVGVRTEAIPGLQTSLDFWLLDLDSELVWDADNGTNNPSAPTRRKGVEWANSYQPLRWLIVDLNVAYSEAHFTKDDDQNENSTGELSGQPVPEAIRWTVAAGASLHELGPFSASLFLRYFGPRVLCTVGTCTDPGTFNPSNGTAIWSSPSTILNAQVSYQITRNVKITLEGLNLLNARVNDIAYYYKTQVTPQGPAAWNYQVHPSEPFELRGTLTLRI
jgi:outer membrane receptor protein involved in Fe transport